MVCSQYTLKGKVESFLTKLVEYDATGGDIETPFNEIPFGFTKKVYETYKKIGR